MNKGLNVIIVELHEILNQFSGYKDLTDNLMEQSAVKSYLNLKT